MNYNISMNNLLFVLLQVFLQAYSTKRDAIIRLLIAEIRMLRSRIPDKRILLTAKEKNLLLDIGVELNHKIDDFILIVHPKTYKKLVTQTYKWR